MNCFSLSLGCVLRMFFKILANLRLKVVIKKSVDGMTSLHNGQPDYVTQKNFRCFYIRERAGQGGRDLGCSSRNLISKRASTPAYTNTDVTTKQSTSRASAA